MSESTHNSVATRFSVEYTYETRMGSRYNTSMSAGANQIGPMPTRSETAVASYLQRKHPDCHITIRNLRWFNMFNEEV
jgi:hypothetical protein